MTCPATEVNLYVVSIDLTPRTPNDSPPSTEAKGIFQSDLAIRHALIASIRELRAHPYLLDYCFASLLEDELTVDRYGDKERQRAKRWFLSTDIPVTMDYHMTAPEGSMLSVALVDTTEAETTVSDTHYQPTESVESIWPMLAGPFDVVSYVASTGEITLPQDIADAVLVVPTMILVDRAGREFEILSVTDRTHFKVLAGLQLDLRGSLLKGAQPALVQYIESLAFKEVYRVGVHALGEPYILGWLHSIAVFCLLRSKQSLLEARGFERSTVSSGPFAKDERWNVQNLWTRFITVNGYCRQSWPKAINERIRAVSGLPQFSRTGETTSTFLPAETIDPGEELWDAQDGIGDPIE